MNLPVRHLRYFYFFMGVAFLIFWIAPYRNFPEVGLQGQRAQIFFWLDSTKPLPKNLS